MMYGGFVKNNGGKAVCNKRSANVRLLTRLVGPADISWCSLGSLHSLAKQPHIRLCKRNNLSGRCTKRKGSIVGHLRRLPAAQDDPGYGAFVTLLPCVRPNGAILVLFTIFKNRRLANSITGRMCYFTVDQTGNETRPDDDPYHSSSATIINDYHVTRIYMLLAKHGF
jgi:hypothetical protein